MISHCQPRRNPLHLLLFMIGEGKKDEIGSIVGQCSNAYLVSFIFSYTGGLLFGIYSIFSVMSQYKSVSLARQSGRFKLRNRMLRAIKREVGPSNALANDLWEQPGFILDFHHMQHSVLFAALQASTAYLSLLVIGYLGSALLSALFCGYFWTQVVPRIKYQLITFAVVMCTNVLAFWLATFTVRQGNKEVTRPG